jgi:hypothetical protein
LTITCSQQAVQGAADEKYRRVKTAQKRTEPSRRQRRLQVNNSRVMNGLPYQDSNSRQGCKCYVSFKVREDHLQRLPIQVLREVVAAVAQVEQV